MDKRGQALSMQTIIIIILAVVVLVFITLHFTGGLQQLWSRMVGEYSQADITAAKMACEMRSADSFCTEPYLMYREKTKDYAGVMCYENPIFAKIIVGNKTIKSKSGCEELGYTIE